MEYSKKNTTIFYFQRTNLTYTNNHLDDQIDSPEYLQLLDQIKANGPLRFNVYVTETQRNI